MMHEASLTLSLRGLALVVVMPVVMATIVMVLVAMLVVDSRTHIPSLHLSRWDSCVLLSTTSIATNTSTTTVVAITTGITIT